MLRPVQRMHNIGDPACFWPPAGRASMMGPPTSASLPTCPCAAPCQGLASTGARATPLRRMRSRHSAPCTRCSEPAFAASRCRSMRPSCEASCRRAACAPCTHARGAFGAGALARQSQRWSHYSAVRQGVAGGGPRAGAGRACRRLPWPRTWTARGSQLHAPRQRVLQRDTKLSKCTNSPRYRRNTGNAPGGNQVMIQPSARS